MDMHIEKWRKLLCEERISGSSQATKTEHRTKFDEDIDRIVITSAFRRLQDKTQVFPLQENDYIRTRLTHSIETATIARSLGLAVENYILNQFKLDNNDFNNDDIIFLKNKIPSLLYAAALIHDIGNPPFGHFGEDIIKNWFTDYFSSDRYNNLKNTNSMVQLNEFEMADFKSFDGNAQTLRIVTRLQFLKGHYGLNLTYGLLSALIKYPVDSTVTSKKFGYFQDDIITFRKVREKTGLKCNEDRNPLTYLLEAADDIAYTFSDVEDGIKKGLIPWLDYFKKFKDAFKDDPLVDIFDKEMEHVYKDMPSDEKELYHYMNFKVRFQGRMIVHVIEAFKQNYDKIMRGENFSDKRFNRGHYSELITCSCSNKVHKELFSLLPEYCFNSREVVKLELSADKIMTTLLSYFVSAVEKNEDVFINTAKTKEEKILQLISWNFKHILKNISESPNYYQKLLLITDFISGMTDTYALSLYKELVGVKAI